MSDYLDPSNEELLKDFFEEANQQVEILEQNIIVMENDPENRDSVDEIFRAAHTLKGGAATVEMKELAEFTHLVEDVLDEIRADRLPVDRRLIDVLLRAIDIIKAMVHARAEGVAYQQDISAEAGELRGLKGGPGAGKRGAASSAGAAAAPAPELSEYDMLELRSAAGSGEPIQKVRVRFNEHAPMNTVGGVQVFAVLNKAGKLLSTEPDFDRLYEDVFHPVVDYYVASDMEPEELAAMCRIPEVTLEVEVTSLSEQDMRAAAREESPPPAAREEGGALSSAEQAAGPERGEAATAALKKLSYGSMLRVDSRRIDLLLNLVGETIIIKATFNQVASQFAESLADFQTTQERYRDVVREFFEDLPDYLDRLKNGFTLSDFKKELQSRFDALLATLADFEAPLRANIAKFRNAVQILGRITGELQEGVMKIRMVPISQLFSRFPRLVRDLTRSLGKEVELVVEGEDTELDKSVIEDILDPLIHCVRNAIDHGVEPPEARRKIGKGPRGTVRLSARNEGNSIIISVSDDGRGIDVDSVRSRAVERGLIHPSKVLSDVEAFNVIFEPGFSTAATVTNISGRGVGLDVVRKQVEKLKGSVSVWSEPGQGTTFTIKLPLTLAIIQGLMVKVGREQYVIPVGSVIESLRVRPGEIDLIDHYEVFNFRDDVLSLLRLDRLFKVQSTNDKPYSFVVIVGTGDKKVGLMVDSLIGEEDVVIKPLRDRFTGSPGIAGATILGDGSVSLILDVGQLLDLGLKRELDERLKRETTIS